MDADAQPCHKCVSSVTACVILAVTFVASLYVWNSPHHRDHPSVIKQRSLSVFVMMLISPMLTWLFLHESTLQKNTLLEVLGLRLSGLFQALVFPLLLTMILFLGPVTDLGFRGFKSVFSEKSRDSIKFSSERIQGIEADADNGPVLTESQIFIGFRNYLVAPLGEEVIFRACMLPLLLDCFEPLKAVFICPLFFGTAHFNHLVERVYAGVEFKHAFPISFFQFLYTTVFGAYSAYLFVRTGHFMPSFLAHVFCNFMGLADIGEILTFQEPRRTITVINFFVGFILWCYLLVPMTNPSLYANNLFWSSKLS